MLYNGYDFQYCVNPDSDDPIFLINTHIGEGGIDGGIFDREFTLLDGMRKNSLSCYINSHGGEVDAGASMFNSVFRAKTRTKSYVTFLAASISGVFTQAFNERYMYSNGMLMIHNPSVANEDTTIEEDPILMKYKKSLMIMLEAKTNLSLTQISNIMNKETWMDAEEALKCGFIDEILPYKETIDKIVFDDIKDELVLNNTISKYNLILNKIVNKITFKEKNKNKTMIEKFRVILNLADNATENEVYMAAKASCPWMFKIDKEIENTKSDNNHAPALHKISNDEMCDDDEMCNEDLKSIKNDDDDDIKNDDDKKEVIDYESKYKDLLNTIENANEAKINDKFTSAVKLGKVKESERPNYIKLGKLDFKTVENILDSLTVNKTNISLNNVIDKSGSEKVITETKNLIADKVKKDINNGKVINETTSGNTYNLHNLHKRIVNVK